MLTRVGTRIYHSFKCTCVVPITRSIKRWMTIICELIYSHSHADIPLTPKERSLLTGEGNNEPTGVRASHSSESVLDAPDTPPPKPARPNRYGFKSENRLKSD